MRLSKEMHRRIFELTLALYRVTDFFPASEVLKRHLREKANEIFGSMAEYDFSSSLDKEAIKIIAKIQSIKGFLRISRTMKLVKPINLAVLEREYENLGDYFERELDSLREEKTQYRRPENNKSIETGEGPVVKERTKMAESQTEKLGAIGQKNTSYRFTGGPTERQKAIIEQLKQKNTAKISDFFSFFSNISTKTIQRDLQDLVQRNILRKEGEKRWTYYTLNNVR